jgi:hypothetical protein
VKELDVREMVSLFIRLKLAVRLHTEGLDEEDILGESYENIGAKFLSMLNL